MAEPDRPQAHRSVVSADTAAPPPAAADEPSGAQASGVQASGVPARAGALLVATALLILVAGTPWLPLLDRDEPRFARATVEMLERGDWVVPTFNGQYRFDKPPLTYWLMAVGYGVFGVGEFGARAHAILATLAVTLGLFWFGCRLYGRAAGFAAAFAWATCLQVFLHGRLALADMPMVAAVLAVHVALWQRLTRPPGGRYDRWFWTLWLGLAFGFLAKGPIALASPALTLLAWRLLRRRPLPWRRLGAGVGAAIALAVVGAWGIPALVRTHGLFWQVGIGEHVVRRGTVAFNDRPVVPFYYLGTVFLSLFPWSPMLGRAVGTLRQEWRRDETRFLLAWVLGPTLIFSFYSTQLPHYTMPAFPALLLLTFRHGFAPPAGGVACATYRGLHLLFALLWLGGAPWLLMHRLPGAAAGLRTPLLALLGVLAAMQALAWLAPRAWRNGPAGVAPAAVQTAARRPTRPLIPAGVAASVLAIAAATSLFATSVRPLSASLRVRDAIAGLPPQAKRIARGYTEPSLVFYAGGPWEFTGPAPNRSLLAPQTGPIAFVYRLGEQGLDDLLAGRTPAGPESLAQRARAAGVPAFLLRSSLPRVRLQGFNFARSTWTDLLVFVRR